MPKSEAFIRIKTDVLCIVKTIPHGKLTSFQAVGYHLDVMPRHVAYILSMLSPEEKLALPWYRVTADKGLLGAVKLHADGRTQAALLMDEGVKFTAVSQVADYDKYFVEVKALKHGIALQTRPTELPRATRPRKA
jgi:methylated-DNA-protein-cysteine methyltransferase related protein